MGVDSGANDWEMSSSADSELDCGSLKAGMTGMCTSGLSDAQIECTRDRNGIAISSTHSANCNTSVMFDDPSGSSECEELVESSDTGLSTCPTGKAIVKRKIWNGSANIQNIECCTIKND